MAHGGSGEGVQQQRDRGGRRQLAAADRSADDRPGGQDPVLLDHPPVLGDARDVFGLQRDSQRRPSRVPDVPEQELGGQRDQFLADVAGLDLLERDDASAQRLDQQLLLGRPAQVDRRLADAGPAGHELDVEPGPAGLAEDRDRSLGHSLVDLGVARPARRDGDHGMPAPALYRTGSPVPPGFSITRSDPIR